MRCEDAIEQLLRSESAPDADAGEAAEHASGCDDCRAALRAVAALHTLRREQTPTARDGAIEQTIERALELTPEPRHRRAFWTGLASGLALAATLALVVVGVRMANVAERGAAVPEIRLALRQPRDVTVTLETPERLRAAAVRVELRGAVALDGYADQRELNWFTDLEPGVTRLTLPVVALEAAGGQVLVEISHGDRRRTFVLDVRTTGRS